MSVGLYSCSKEDGQSDLLLGGHARPQLDEGTANASRTSHSVKTTPKRRPLWVFESLKTIRHRFIRRAGRLLFPQGRFTLSLSANEVVERDFEKYLPPQQAS